MLEEYRETLRGLYVLLERKQAQRQKVWQNVALCDRLNREINLVWCEIYEIQDVIRKLERRERDDVYGYRWGVHRF